MQGPAADQEIPKLGFGTYGRIGDAGVAAIRLALETGYRHLDTAQSYGTERECGEAIRQSGLKRAEVFVTTKIDTGNLGQGKVLPSLEKSLDALRVDQVDLTLIHWPAPNGSLPLALYLDQLAEARAKGLSRLIGVSNFPVALLAKARSLLGEGQITTNQFECNPLFRNEKLANYCRDAGILVTCYLPIARGGLRGIAAAELVAARHGADVSQIAVAYELAKGYAAIPTSSRADRIVSNFAASRLTLSSEDMVAIGNLPQSSRRIDPDWGPDWD